MPGAGRGRGRPVEGFLSSLLLLPLGLSPVLAQEGARPPAPTGMAAEAIVARLQEENARRDRRLAGYQVRRVYYLKNELSKKEARMEVEVVFESPAELRFTVHSQQGSGFLARRVFGRMMEGEQESLAADAKQRSALTPENYDFVLRGEEKLRGRGTYRLQVTPRREDTFLFAGQIWIDAEDFALVEAEGTVSKRPSFWTRKIDFRRTFKKVGPFWLPERTESITEVLLFGTAWVTIENGDYRVRLEPRAQQGARITSPLHTPASWARIAECVPPSYWPPGAAGAWAP